MNFPGYPRYNAAQVGVITVTDRGTVDVSRASGDVFAGLLHEQPVISQP